VVLPWLCVAAGRSIATVTRTLGRVGLRTSVDLEEIWRSFVALEDSDARQAFLHTVRSIIDIRGQRVNATDKLYLAGELPTLIVWGERDPLIPVRHAHAAHARIPGSRIEVFPGAGHFPYRDNPQRFASVVLEFLETTTPNRIDESRWRDRLRDGPLSSLAS